MIKQSAPSQKMNPLINFFIFFLLPISSIAQSQFSISLSNKTLPKSGDPITIHWSGLDSPNKLDWVGIYSPPTSSHDNFIGYLFLSTSPTWESGSGSITLPLINLRSNYQFRIFKWNESEIDPTRQDQDHNPLPGTDHLVAESEEVGFETGRGPEQVHLALTGREREIRVMFVTYDGKESFVRYGLKHDRLDRVVGTLVGRYEREDLCHAPANESIGWRDPGFVHDGVITNLKQGKKYYYQVGSDSGGWSTTFNFVSQDEDSSETIAFLFGDMGTATPYSTFLRTQQESISTIKWIKRDLEDLGDEKPAFISHIGDLSYARGYSWLWDNFFNQIEPIASKVPYHVCIGNHEYDWPAQPFRPEWSTGIYGTDGGGECGVPYSYKFNMPGNSSEVTSTRALTKNLYYSVNVGVVHFVFISTETNFLQGSDQYKFIKNDLESVNRKKTPFVVVQGHRPMYTSSLDIKGIPLRAKMAEHLEPLLVKNKVNLVLWGHVHRYERFCPMSNSVCGNLSSGLPVHIVIGMGGQDWQKIWEPRSDHPNDPVFPQPARSLYRSGELGYTRLFATKKKLTFSYVGNHDGEVHDVVNILPSGEVVYDNSGWREMIASS